MSSAGCHRIVLFTKPAVPGLVKTRLQIADGSDGPVLTPAQAADLHLAFLRDVSDALQVAVRSLPSACLEVAWALDGGLAPEPGFEHLHGFVQVGETLGERLLHGLSRDWCETAAHMQAGTVLKVAEEVGGADEDEISVVVAVGSDHPELQAGVVSKAVEVVSTGAADLAIGPAEDGGYYLLAVRREVLSEVLFSGVEWSTNRVLEQTLDRAGQMNLRVHRLESGFDCDTPIDLLGLCQRLEEGARESRNCVATRRWLIEEELLKDGPALEGGAEGVKV